MKLLGIDDAGRGPVLGPMILAGVLVDSKDEEKKLKEIGVKDSKLLYPSTRKKISKTIIENYKYEIQSTSAKEIDTSLARGTNLNQLEAIKVAKIINKLTENEEIPTKNGEAEKIRVIIDCPSVNKESWQDFLVTNLTTDAISKINILCSHKADLKYPIVGAASIIAKEQREDEIKELKKDLNINFGSGYPSDPKTKEFLLNNHDNEKYSDIIRKSWQTYKKIVKQKDEKQSRLF